MCRARIEVQKESYLRNGNEEYEFLALGPHPCEVCSDMNGKIFKVGELAPGDTAPPMHPNCMCSTAPYWDEDKFQEWLDYAGSGGDLDYGEWAAEEARAEEWRQSVEALHGIDTEAKGDIIEGEYDPADIRKATAQDSTNFVIRDINHPDSLYGELCEAIPRISGFYDMKMHGSPDRVKIFNSPVDAKELARIILFRKDYSGEPIRLLSCETGKIQNGTCIAMQLSQALGVDVMAPTEDMFASSSGRIVIESKEGKRGWMRVFHPDGSYEDDF